MRHQLYRYRYIRCHANNPIAAERTKYSEETMTTASIAIPREGQKEVAAQGWVVLLGRLLFALIFIMSGPNHFAKQTIAYAAAQGVPLASLAVPFSGLIAIAGGLSILFGY